jgi:hypothetical protein
VRYFEVVAQSSGRRSDASYGATVLAEAGVGLVHMDVDTIPMSEPRTSSSASLVLSAAVTFLHAADPLLL